MHFHFTNAEGTLQHGDNRQVVEGETLSVKDPRRVVCCHYGMHSSERIVDALLDAPGLRLWIVSHPGGVVERQHDKCVGVDRKAEKDLGDITDVIVRLSRWFANRTKEHAIAAVGAHWAAIAAARDAAVTAATATASYAAYWGATWRQERNLQEKWLRTELGIVDDFTNTEDTITTGA